MIQNQNEKGYKVGDKVLFQGELEEELCEVVEVLNGGTLLLRNLSIPEMDDFAAAP